MRSNLLAIWRVLFGLIILGLFAWLAYTVVLRVAHWLSDAKSEVAVAIVAAGASVTISILSLMASNIFEARRAIAQELREKKTPVYEEFVRTIYRVLFAEQLGKKQPSKAELAQFFADYTEKLTIWGSDEVIKVWGELRLSASDADGALMLFRYEELLLSIRKDLGHRNKGFKRGRLLRLFVNDIDRYLK